MSDPMMPLPVIEAEPTSVPPAVLLANHLKALKLPSFAREYEKVAFEAAQDRADYPRYRCACANWSASTVNAGWSSVASAWPGSRIPRVLTPSTLQPSHH
jgi:hypothetical protein